MFAFSRIGLSFVLLVFAMLDALADAQWGIHIAAGDEACELKTPVKVDGGSKSLGGLWVGFYWLKSNSEVPGHTLPKGEVLFIVETETKSGGPNLHREPASLAISGFVLKKYQFEAGPASKFFFASGSDAERILEVAKTSGTLQIEIALDAAETQTFQINAGVETGFGIYAKMFETCNRAIAS